MNEAFEVVAVTLSAAVALVALVRSYVPARQKPSKPTGCSHCGSNTAHDRTPHQTGQHH